MASLHLMTDSTKSNNELMHQTDLKLAPNYKVKKAEGDQ